MGKDSLVNEDTAALASARDFLGYVDTHSRTERALFSRLHAERLFRMAARDLPEPFASSSAGWIAMHHEDIRDVLRAARRLLTGVEAIEVNGSWTTLVLFEPRIAGFPGSIDTPEGWPSIAGVGDMLRLSDRLALALKASGLVSALVLVRFTEGPFGYEADYPDWQLEVDGEPCDVATWFGANREGLDVETLLEVVNLAPGDGYAGGGGAAAEWAVRRLP